MNPNRRRTANPCQHVPWWLLVGALVLGGYLDLRYVPAPRPSRAECNYSTLEVVIADSLSAQVQDELGAESCSTQRALLDNLVQVRRPQRDEIIARALNR